MENTGEGKKYILSEKEIKEMCSTIRQIIDLLWELDSRLKLISSHKL